MTYNNQIQQLQSIIQKHKITFEYLEEDYLDPSEYYKAVLFLIGDKVYKIYVDHEYRDLDLKIQELSLFLVLRELELASECEDFEIWVAEQMIQLNDRTINYYYDLKAYTTEIEGILGSIDPIISQMEFELNSGAIQELRNR